MFFLSKPFERSCEPQPGMAEALFGDWLHSLIGVYTPYFGQGCQIDLQFGVIDGYHGWTQFRCVLMEFECIECFGKYLVFSIQTSPNEGLCNSLLYMCVSLKVLKSIRSNILITYQTASSRVDIYVLTYRLTPVRPCFRNHHITLRNCSRPNTKDQLAEQV